MITYCKISTIDKINNSVIACRLKEGHKLTSSHYKECKEKKNAKSMAYFW